MTCTRMVDDAVGVSFVAYLHPDGTADIMHEGVYILCGIPADIAADVEKAQREFREALYSLLCTRRN